MVILTLISYNLEVTGLDNMLNRMERKFGRYAIHDLTRIIIITYIIGYLLQFMGLTGYVSMNPYNVINHFQIWRVVTWILMPPSDLSIFTIIMLIFYYSIGTSLERTWGAFRYNVYMLSGLLFTVIGAFAVYFIGNLFGTATIMGYSLDPANFGFLISTFVTTYYINMSIFLAFAANYPDMQILLYFLIPIKIKWIAILDAVYIAWHLVNVPWYGKVIIVVSLLNFLIFYLSTFNLKSSKAGSFQRSASFGRRTSAQRSARAYTSRGGGISKHKCAVCGRTELDDPTLEFRFCSKCNGNYEYCQDHLFTHKHVE